MEKKDIEMEKIKWDLEKYNSIEEFYYGERENLIQEALNATKEVISPDDENSLLRMIVYEDNMRKLRITIAEHLPIDVIPGTEANYLQRFYDYYGLPKNIDFLFQKFSEKESSYSRKLK